MRNDVDGTAKKRGLWFKKLSVNTGLKFGRIWHR